MKATKLQRLVTRDVPYSEFSRKVPIGTHVNLPSGERLVFTDRSTLHWHMELQPKISTGKSCVHLCINLPDLYTTLNFLLMPDHGDIHAFVEECVSQTKALYGDLHYIVSDTKPASPEDMEDFPKVAEELYTKPGTAFVNWQGDFMECSTDPATGGLFYEVDNHVSYSLTDDLQQSISLARAFFSGGIAAMDELLNAPTQETVAMTSQAVESVTVEEIYTIRGTEVKVICGSMGLLGLSSYLNGCSIPYVFGADPFSGKSYNDFYNDVLGTPGEVRDQRHPFKNHGELEKFVDALNSPMTLPAEVLWRTKTFPILPGDNFTFTVKGESYSYKINSNGTAHLYGGGGTDGLVRNVFGGYTKFNEFLTLNGVTTTGGTLLANPNFVELSKLLGEVLHKVHLWEKDWVNAQNIKNLPKTVRSANEMSALGRDLILGDKVIFGDLETTVVDAPQSLARYGLRHTDVVSHIHIHCGITPEEHNPRAGTWGDDLKGLTNYVHWLYEKLADKMESEAQAKELEDIRKSFTFRFNQVASMVHQTAKDKGFWDKDRNDSEMIMLMVTELGEAVEALRKDLKDDKIPDRKGVEVELADCLIRIMDYAKGRGLDLPGAMFDKMAYNKTREKLHGKSF